MLEDGDALKGRKGSLYISGTVSYIEDMSPIKGVEIYVNDSLMCTSNVQGAFQMFLKNMENEVELRLTAIDNNGIYSSVDKIVLISWSETSYDSQRNAFVVNDCDFQLEKADEPDII
ncbi:MAG: hypothetical protein J6A22_09190 [Bacteroidales bacterium]|nr:hypothetical protein [Bacteroidales bacterium]